jgi:hypothetical protein
MGQRYSRSIRQRFPCSSRTQKTQTQTLLVFNFDCGTKNQGGQILYSLPGPDFSLFGFSEPAAESNLKPFGFCPEMQEAIKIQRAIT